MVLLHVNLKTMLMIWKRVISNSHCSQLIPINRTSQTHLYRAISSTHVPSTHGELAHSLISVRCQNLVYTGLFIHIITSVVLRLFGIACIHSTWHMEGRGFWKFIYFVFWPHVCYKMAFRPLLIIHQVSVSVEDKWHRKNISR